MKAMIFAAGRGERMGELTRQRPKPMLEVAGKPLIQHAVERLAAAGFRELVINIAYLGEQIRAHLGDGRAYGVNIAWSPEPEPLETGGGIAHALPLLGQGAFAIINADVWTDYPFDNLHVALEPGTAGRLVMVPNPDHLPAGDFYLRDGRLHQAAQSPTEPRWTYSGIAVLDTALVADYPQRRAAFPLGEVFRAAIARSELAGEPYRGEWRDIGTPERLRQLEEDLAR